METNRSTNDDNDNDNTNETNENNHQTNTDTTNISSSSNIDITSIFEEAVDSLSYTNPILCDESSFDLYDTMAALELMDTKMDSCEIPASFYRCPPPPPKTETITSSKDKNQNETNDKKNNSTPNDDTITNTKQGKRTMTVPPRPAPTKVNDPLTPLPWEILSLNQARIIVLEMSTRFESMIRGSNIAESVYTCLYAHDKVLADMKVRLEFDAFARYGQPDFATNLNEEEDGGEQIDASNVPSRKETKAARWAVYASALLLVKLTELVRRIVRHADTYEEEDFSLSTYSFTFFRDGGRIQPTFNTHHYNEGRSSTTQYCNEIGGGCDDMLDVVKVCVSAKKAMKMMGMGEEEEEEAVAAAACDDSETSRNIQMIERVLDYFVDIYSCCATLGKLTKNDFIEKVASVKQTIERGLQNVDTLITMLKQQTRQQTQQCNDEYHLILLQAFDLNVNRHLLGNTPVRKVHFHTPCHSLQYLRALFHSIDWAVCNLLLRGTTIDRIRRMLSHMSTSTYDLDDDGDSNNNDNNNVHVNILVRSLVVLNLYFDDLLLGRHILPCEIALHMQRHGVPKPITDTVYGLKFLDRLGKPMYDTLKVLTLNRNRQRAYLDGVMFREWEVLQREAVDVDRAFCEEFQLGGGSTGSGGGRTTMPFVTNYVLGITVGLMVHYLTLGIELDLVTGHYDMSTTYWYLDFLLSTQLNVENSMRDSMLERRALQAEIEADEATATAAAAGNSSVGGKGRPLSSGSKSEKGKKRGGKKSNRRGGNNSITSNAARKIVPTKPVETAENREDSLELLILEMRRTKCRGIVRFISALYQAKIVTPPTYTFTTHEICFQKRFHSFRSIHQPRLLTFNDFQAGSDFSSVTPKDLLASTTGCFKTCRTIVDVILKQYLTTIEPVYSSIRREEALSLVKVCVGNSLFLHKLSQVVENGDGKVAMCKASLNFKTHKHFCTITLS